MVTAVGKVFKVYQVLVTKVFKVSKVPLVLVIPVFKVVLASKVHKVRLALQEMAVYKVRKVFLEDRVSKVLMVD